ncbi:MAG: metallophosphoesterase [Candidatus Aminicenantes bacterium]
MIRSTRKVKKFTALLLSVSLITVFLYGSSTQCVWSDIEKIVAVGDIHGDYKNFVKILKGTKLIDEQLHWTGGKTHLVQTGDIMDRGPDAKKVFDLLMKLEEEAEKTGGKIHVLIGNHEEMNITGIAFDYAGYVTVEQFVSFLPEKYRKKKKKEFTEKTGENEIDQDKYLDNSLKKYWLELMKEKSARKKYVDNFNDKYGKWILSHNAVIKINHVIFVHGGISRQFSTWKIEDINEQLQEELCFLQKAAKRPRSFSGSYNPKIVYKSEGPLWYRGLALEDEQNLKQEVDKILENLGAKYMVIAHTPRAGSRIVSEEYMSRFDGRIWIIDTGISDYYGGFLSALIIENENFTLWRPEHEK